MIDKILGKLILAERAFAASSGGPGGSGGSGSGGTKDLNTILNDLIDWAAGLALTLAALMIIYAAYQMLTAGGNAEQFDKGKKTITYAVAGIFVILLSRAIIEIIKQLIGA